MINSRRCSLWYCFGSGHIIVKVNNVIKYYQTINTFYYIAVQFIFTPSPNIGIYQLAHYRCSVNHTGVGITWNVNKTVSTNNDIIQLGIVTSGTGSSNSSLTIPGYPQYNNTIVRCTAFGSVDDNNYFNFSVSTLRIQGTVNISVWKFKCWPNSKVNCQKLVT